MSLFTDQEYTGYVFNADYSTSTRIAAFPAGFPSASADFQVDINIIRLGADDAVVYSEEFGDYRANVGGVNRSLLKEGQVILWTFDNRLYIVTTKPKQLKLFDKVRIFLRDYEGLETDG